MIKYFIFKLGEHEVHEFDGADKANEFLVCKQWNKEDVVIIAGFKQ